MTLALHTMRSAHGARRKKKRIGRGNASGHGTYSGRGQKGQKARSGGRGGNRLRGLKRFIQQTPKKRGFRSVRTPAVAVNLGTLAALPAGTRVTPTLLKEHALIHRSAQRVKILSMGEVTVPLTIVGCSVSASAKEKIEKAGGKIETPRARR